MPEEITHLSGEAFHARQVEALESMGGISLDSLKVVNPAEVFDVALKATPEQREAMLAAEHLKARGGTMRTAGLAAVAGLAALVSAGAIYTVFSGD
jgi:hypothetical protein